ncbi:MAG: MATE family efflux transporter [Labilithrix sp.]|nr:MATE family efflux transporter [Labilithrix sp.]MCW5816447.1 MATE family efflux transporter [Labilithrix sp.]
MRAYLRYVTPSAGVTRELFQLAWPIAAAMLGETALSLIDTKLVGGLGSAALGGVGVATTFMYLAYAMTYGGMRGVKVRVAHAVGEGKAQDGLAYARAGMIVGLLFGTLVLVACRDVGGVLSRLGADPEIVPYAKDFLAAVTLGAPATCALAALIQHRQGMGDSRTPMIVGIAGNAFNALFAWSLIYGHFGLPALGVRGAGYSTATTEVLELGIMFALLLRDERRATTKPTITVRRAAKDILDLGLPTGIQFTAETLAFTVFTVLLGSISKEEIAAHQIALNVIRTSFLPGVAIAEATSVLVGRSLGRRRLSEADGAVKSGLALAVGFMFLCGVAFALFGGPLGAFFSSDPAVIANAKRLLLVAAVFQVLDAINIVLRGSLRGAKDVRVVAVLGVLIVWSFLPTSAYVLGKHLGLGALGGWLGFVGETAVASILFWRRWKKGPWRRDYQRP